jgi:hypothetical protein
MINRVINNGLFPLKGVRGWGAMVLSQVYNFDSGIIFWVKREE